MTSRKLIQKAKTILEKERGAVRKPWGGRISICLLYPNSYHVGMSNLGFQTVYQRLNSEDDVVCERAFLPDPEDLRDYQRTQTPLRPPRSGGSDWRIPGGLPSLRKGRSIEKAGRSRGDLCPGILSCHLW